MASSGTGLFGGFDLKNPNSLRRLAIALEYRLADDRDRDNASLAFLSPLQQVSIDMTVQRIQHSPLLREIVTPFLNAPRVGNSSLLAAARDLEAYVTPQTHEPNVPSYSRALEAWRNRRPLATTGNAVNAGEALAATTSVDAQQAARSAAKSDRGFNAICGIRKENDTEGESQETVHHSQTQKKDDDKSNKSTESKEEAVRKPRNKGPRNPLLAQASAELSQTYTAPAPAPVQGRSERARRTRKQMDIIDPWADFNEEQLAQVQCDEVAAQYLTERDTGGRNGLRPLSTQLTLQERLRVEQNTSANREREITRSRNRSPTPPVITQFPSAANVAQERLDTQLARDIQREEDLSAGLGPESSGDALDKKSQQNMQVSSSRGDGETTGRRKKLNAPKRRAGDRPINQGIDRQGAKVGVVDKSKLKIDFDTERDDPLHPGVVVPGDSVHYDYLESHTEPDWNNAKDIQALNTWRRQIFGRNFPPIKKTREIWVEREKDAVLDLMRKQLDSRRYLKWNRLANDYNKQMAGVVQNSGEKFLSKGIRQFDGLLEDRAAPWRSTSAIMGQAYLWPEYRALMSETLSDIEALGDQGEESDYKSTYSGDDKEIFDPNPGPKSEVTKRKFPKSQTPTASKTMKIVCNTKPARGRKRKRQEAVVEEEGVEIETKVEDESDELVRTSRTTLKIGRWRGRKDEEDQDGDEEPFFPNLYKTY